MPDIFGVIADANRRDILQVLLERHLQEAEISVSDIVSQLELSQPTVSKHLKVLRDAELVTVREEGQHRFYSLDPEPLEMVEDFVIPFLSAGFDTEVTVEYLSEDGEPVFGLDENDPFARGASGALGEVASGGIGDADNGEVLPEEAAAAAERIGRAAARAEHRVKELVARFRLRG
ncbi:MAG: ArsR/SmtB family transcription factor [Leucobacter sp.]